MAHQEHNITNAADYRGIGCGITDDLGVGTIHGIITMTKGKPCTTGCADFNNGNCAGYKHLLKTANLEG